MGALSDLTITNDGRLWMPADSGRLLRKSSGSLEIITLPTRERLTGIAFSSDDTAWITAADGSLYRSENRGDTWVQQPSPATNALNAVAFADSRTGWLIGADGVVAATADGGENWQADRLLGQTVGMLRHRSIFLIQKYTRHRFEQDLIGFLDLVST